MNKLDLIPFASFAQLKAEDFKAMKINLSAHEDWLLPQLYALIGRTEVPLQDGKVNIKEYLRKNFSDPFMRGIYNVCMLRDRGVLVRKQLARPKYSALVPLLLAPHKEFNNIPYSAWNLPELHWVVEERLFAAMFAEPPKLTAEQLIELRDLGLSTRSGPDAGKKKDPKSQWRLNHLRGTVLETVPDLAVTMLTQIWVAHPSIRTPNMILDPNNWDNMPEPLIDDSLLDFGCSATSPKWSPWNV